MSYRPPVARSEDSEARSIAQGTPSAFARAGAKLGRLAVRLGLAAVVLAAASASAWAQVNPNPVTPASATACITPVVTCQTIPVDIARTDAIGLRLFHVTFQLSGNLQLCGTPSASITEGTYLSAVNSNTTFFITSNGGGSYTVDGTINGTPCGATAASGNLFNISVAGTGTSGTGTVTLTALTLRDCSNVTIPSTIGGPASVSIDMAPVTVAPVTDPQTVVQNSTLTITPGATLSSCATGPATWSVSPALPGGASIDASTGVITWTPSCGQVGTFGPFTYTATAASGETGTSNAFSIVVTHLAGTITVAAITDPQTVAETSTLTVTPGATTSPCVGSPLTWSVSPALPAGATFSTSSGEIQWTPACGEAGTYGPFTLTASAPTGETGSSNAFAITVTHLAGTVTVAAIADPQTVVEQSTLTVTPGATLAGCAAGPVTWSVAPALPAGATFSTSTGEIQWTPACGTAGSYGPFTLTATAATGEVGSSNAFAITVTHLAGTVTVAAIADPQTVVEQSTLGITPGATLTACAAGPVTWSVAPSLPAGATFNTGTGEIQWTPACGTAGTYGPFTLTATASTGETGASNAFSIVVSHLAGTVTVAAIATPQSVSEGALLTITPSAGTTPCAGTLTWSVSPALPTGATFDTGTGVITWTPDCNASTGGAAGTYGPFTLTATASTGEVGTGNAFSIHVDDAPIAVAAPASVTATQVLAGNPVGAQVTGITVHFGAVAGATSYQVYRAPYGHYPEYDDNGGAVPAAPTTWPPAAPWTLTGVTTDGGVDTPPTRDFWYYVVYAANSCGDISVASARTGGTLDYHLGDVSNNLTAGTGDDLVDAADVSLLGSHYGVNLATNDPFAYLDVGPTTNNYVDGRPVTDNRVDFEDLVMFAINFGEVSTAARVKAPLATNATPMTPASTDALTLDAPGAVAPGDAVTATITAQGTGRVQALSVALTWNAAVVEPAGQAAGDFLQGQGGLLMSAAPGTFDAALLGHDVALTGTGTLATVQFRVIAAGDPGIRFASVDARDTRNQKVVLGQTVNVPQVLPTATTLSPVAPNPSRGLATLTFALAHRGPVDVSIYAANGRLVRNLLHATRDPGNYSLAWDGRDDRGAHVAGGVYFVHMTTERAQFTRRMTRLQ